MVRIHSRIVATGIGMTKIIHYDKTMLGFDQIYCYLIDDKTFVFYWHATTGRNKKVARDS